MSEKLLDFCKERNVSYMDIKPNDFIPPYLNLSKKYKYKIYDQQGLEACIAISICSLIEYLHQKSGNEFIEYSKLYLFQNSTEIRAKESLRALFEHGLCEQRLHKYNRENFDKKIPEEAKELSMKIDTTVLFCSIVHPATIKYVLAILGRPVVMGIRHTRSFTEFTVKSSVFHIESDSDIIGTHSMLIVGYCDKNESFIVQNSWGESFGDNGFCYVHYRYICDKYITSLYTLDDINV